jgi:hypothetical protein
MAFFRNPAAGKNHAVLMYHSKRTMKKWSVTLGRDGMAMVRPFEKDALHKASVDSNKLFNKNVNSAGTKFIPQCEGSSGIIGALKINPTYKDDEVDIPFGALVLDLARRADEGVIPSIKVDHLENCALLFAPRASFFLLLFGRVDFKLAYTILTLY